MRRIVSVAVLATGLVAGSFVVAAFNPLGLAGAQDEESPTTESPVDEQSGTRRGPGHFLEGVLDSLVADGTLNQEQADAVVARAREMAPEGRGMSGQGPGRGFLHEGLDSAAEVIGIEVDSLREQLRDGATLAEVAAANGVDAQALIDGLVAAANGRIDEAVAAGDLDVARADELRANLTDRITDMVDHPPRERGRFGPHEGPWGVGPPPAGSSPEGPPPVGPPAGDEAD